MHCGAMDWMSPRSRKRGAESADRLAYAALRWVNWAAWPLEHREEIPKTKTQILTRTGANIIFAISEERRQLQLDLT